MAMVIRHYRRKISEFEDTAIENTRKKLLFFLNEQSISEL